MSPAEELMKQQFFSQMMSQQQAPQQAPYSPITAGTLAGMKAAKESIQMDKGDKDRAMGNAIFRAFSSMNNYNLKPGQMPRGGLQMINEGLPVGMDAYLAEEAKAKQMNAYMLQQQLEQEALHRQEQAKAMQQQMEWQRKEAQDAETKAYNDRYLDIMMAKAGARGSNQPVGSDVVSVNGKRLDLSDYAPIETGTQKNIYSKESKFWDHAYGQLKSIKHDLDKMKDMTEHNVFSPFGSTFGHAPNVAKEYIARAAGQKGLKDKGIKAISDEVVLRKRLVSKFERLSPILEKATKGGAPDVQLMKRFNDLKVYLSEDEPMNVLEDRLNELMEEALDRKQSANLSVSTGRQINTLLDVPGNEGLQEEGYAPGENYIIQQVRKDFPNFANRSAEEIQQFIDSGAYDRVLNYKSQKQGR